MNNFVNQLSDLSLDLLPAATPLFQSMGIPVDEHSLMVAAPIIKFLKNTHFFDISKEVCKQNHYDAQIEKLDIVFKTAFKTVYKLAEDNGWYSDNSEASSYTQNYLETYEDIFNKALDESRKSKRVILGTYLGSTIYHLNSSKPNWDNIFFISSIIEKLTFRQICIIWLIGNKFKDVNPNEGKLCVKNSVAISELNELQSQNFWRPLFDYKNPKEGEFPIPLDNIVPTAITIELKNHLLINEDVKSDFDQAIASMGICPINPSLFPNDFLMIFDDVLKTNKI